MALDGVIIILLTNRCLFAHFYEPWRALSYSPQGLATLSSVPLKSGYATFNHKPSESHLKSHIFKKQKVKIKTRLSANMILQLRMAEDWCNYSLKDNETFSEVPSWTSSQITPSAAALSLAERALGSISALQRPCTVTQTFIQSVINPLSFMGPHPRAEDRVCSRYSYELRLL